MFGLAFPKMKSLLNAHLNVTFKKLHFVASIMMCVRN